MKKILILIAIFSLSACSGDNDVASHKAGVYQGKIDKHDKTAKQRADILQQRFQMVQTDR